MRIIGATLTPFNGALAGTPRSDYDQPGKDQLREQVNDWIRGAGEFDRVIGLDRMMRDPDQRQRLLPAFESGDPLQPGDRGNRARAEAIDLDRTVSAVSGSTSTPSVQPYRHDTGRR